MKPFRIKTLFAIFFCMSQSVYSSDSEQENTSAVDSLFGRKEESQKPDDAPLWNKKSDFIAATSRGEMSEYRGGDIKFLNSLRIILANDYKTPVPEPKNDGGNTMNCNDTFDIASDSLVKHITEISMAQVSDIPPNFTGILPDNANEIGRNIFSNFTYNCSQEVLGKKSLYPFVNSLASLMKEYRYATDVYAKKLQQERIASYNQSLLKEAELKAQIAAADEKLKQSNQAKAEFEEAEHIRLAACKNTSAYKRYTLSYDIKSNLDAVQSAQQAIKKENEIGRVSGYVNASNLNKLGRLIVFHKDRANASYSEYKRNGGTASSSEKVENLKDPCE